MIIYCDGSANNSDIIAWGIIAKEGDNMAEITGYKKVSGNLKAAHEAAAFVESVLYAYSHGVMPEDVSFYTDDKALVDGAHYHNVHAWGNAFCLSPALTRSLIEVSSLYPPGTINVVIGYLERSHIVWIKGHSGNFMNSRADYLAKRTMRRAGSTTKNSILDMNEWAKTGLLTAKGTVHVPFLNTFIQEVAKQTKHARKMKAAFKPTNTNHLLYRVAQFVTESFLYADGFVYDDQEYNG